MRHAVAVGEGSSKLSVLSRGPFLIFLFDMLLVTGRGSGGT